MISLSEIRNRALRFQNEWAGTTYERGEAQSFWNDFFQIFDVSRRRVATFEEPIKKLGGSQGFIDLFWKGQLLIEHKSFGKDLRKAKTQALDYFPNMPERDLPKFILVCDFQNFELYDLDENVEYHFTLDELHKNIEIFAFIAGYQKKTYKEEEPTNRAAAELMGKLHDKLLENGYEGHELELYLTRLLFCMFAEDTGIFPKNGFREFVELYTDEDGRNLGSQIGYLFQIFDTPNDKRPKNLDESFTQFPYVNGQVFSEQIRIATFDRSMREMLLDACAFDWSVISPAIFGSMFQASMDTTKRGELGAHFTSEKNILKAIKQLFLDELWEEFGRIKNNPKQLQVFHAKISNLKFLDPACGSGNFLVIAYRELKLVEFEVLKVLKILTQLVHIDQFYGFEIEELPSRITQMAMLLIDHQMNLRFAQMFGEPHFNIPIVESANIFNVNALRADWKELLNGTHIDYIIGNPPFLGSKLQSKEQKADMTIVFNGVKNAGDLDFVAAWYVKAAQLIQGTSGKVALVSTNSITQGEQVGILWQELFNRYHVKIHFAHRTFKWNNEAKRNAAVFCVIIGFAAHDTKIKRIFEYETPISEPHEIIVQNINPYLVRGDDFFISSKRKHIQNSVPQILFGSMPNDGGNFLFTDDEKEEFLAVEQKAEKYIKPLISAKEYLNSKNRWCLWLKDCPPNELSSMPHVLERVNNVKKIRSESNREATKKLAKTPMLFGEDRQPDSDYVLIPLHSSENRMYIPFGFCDKSIIANNSTSIVPNVTLYHFGILTSKIHMDWVRYTCGRIKSDYRYSNEIVYNNFPFPQEITDKQREQIETLAQAILDARTQFPDSSLADLYNPLTMPPKLLKAHEALDKAVDKLYRKEGFKSDTERVAHLFELNRALTSLIGVEKPKKRGKK
ncbi:MAG: SAM-dependent methyltransferase [Sulfurovum sp. 24-42-9]|nr:MAG: SAM-dependent methyltransferase [Sulfurovum sp. 24-42-9]HQS77243.1 N-6 DNA methylase [Sulfurovum sp.]